MNKNTYISQEEFELIEKYLLKKMTTEEQLKFENSLKTDSELREKIEECRTLIDTIEIQSLKEKMDDFHNDVSSEVISIIEKPKNQWQKFAIAASIAVLIGLGGVWFLNNKSEHQKLYTKYYKPDPGLPTVMSSTNEYNFYDAMVNYKRGDYKLAIEKWELLLKQKPQNDTLNYFLGVAHLSNGSENKALPYLSRVAETEESVFKNEAYYYLGLAYLKNDNVELAKKNLELSDSKKANIFLNEFK